MDQQYWDPFQKRILSEKAAFLTSNMEYEVKVQLSEAPFFSKILPSAHQDGPFASSHKAPPEKSNLLPRSCVMRPTLLTSTIAEGE